MAVGIIQSQDKPALDIGALLRTKQHDRCYDETEMVHDLLEFNLSLYQDWLPARKHIKKFANIDL